MASKKFKRKKRLSLQSLNKIPTFVRILVFLLIIIGVGLVWYGPERAYFQVKAKVRSFVSPTGYGSSFIDPLLKNDQDQYQDREISFKFGVVGDSHGDTTYYPQILERLKEEGVSFIVHLGDYVNEGSIQNLTEAKELLDKTGIPYYSVCGNHDHNFWPVRQTKNYQEVFGSLYYSFIFGDVQGIILNNSSSYLGIQSEQMKWLKKTLAENNQSLKFIFLHIPPYHPFQVHTMTEENPGLANQVAELLETGKKYGVDEIFSGHLHVFSRYFEPSTQIKMTVVGASGSDRNLFPSYSVVTVYEDLTYLVENRALDKKE